MRLHFVWIGKTRDSHCAALTAEYLHRIERFAPCEVSELKEQTGNERRVIATEGAKLIAAVERDDFVALLDERGREFSSVEFSQWLDARRQSSKRLAFIIGGFAGVSDEVRRRADLTFSLSRFTLTHELARVVLTEQVYRAFTLLAGLPYHKV